MERKMVETPLLNRAVEFLEEISEAFRIDIGRLREDKDYFASMYRQLKENLAELKKLKDEMEQSGFDSPYFALGMSRFGSPLGKHTYKREDVEDQRDVARHKMFFRTDASFKKGTFERTKSAIASHNIAIGHLEEFAAFRCRCGRITRGKEAAKVLEDKSTFRCPKCGSSDGELMENEDGVYRLELLPHLPYGGEFTHEISKFQPTERMAYRELIEVLREKKRGRIKSATVTFKALQNGRWVRKKKQVKVEEGSKLDYEGYLRKKYGRIVIENIRYHHERSILVSGRYNRQALAIAYTKILRQHKESILEYLLGKRVNIDKLREYEDVRKKVESRIYRASSMAFAMDMRVAEERREMMDELDQKLMELGLMDKDGNLIPELDEAIKLRHEIRKGTLIKIPRAVFAWDIFKFLLIKPYRERRYASIFPGLQPVPERDQLTSVLNILGDEDLISAIKMFIDGDVISIPKAEDIIFKKFEIEEILQDYLKVTSSRAVGGISLYLNSRLSLEESAGVVTADVEELKEVLKVIIRLGRRDVIPVDKLEGLEEIKKIKISDKARQFLELVR
jgi:hypothetical protein